MIETESRSMRCERQLFIVGLTIIVVMFAGPRSAFSQVELMNESFKKMIIADLLEVAANEEGSPLEWDIRGSIGKSYNSFWIESDGAVSTTQSGGEIDFRALYSRLVAAFWEAQVGVRYDVGYAAGSSETRAHAVIGLHGLAPYWWELEPALYVSQDGDVSASFVASYDLFVTQRLILQPRVEAAAAVQEVPEWGVGAGLNDVDLGMRLRVEIRRKFAPYVGLGWTRQVGQTADFARTLGEPTSALKMVAGVRMWY